MLWRVTVKIAGLFPVKQRNPLAVEGPAANPGESVRVDLWAWSVRLFKTRNHVAAACKKSQLLINGQRCRAAKLVRVGDEIQFRQGLLTRTFEVKGILKRRVGAKEIAPFLLDRTPEEEYQRVAAIEKASRESTPQREAGMGRPTKRDRREMEEVSGGDVEEGPTFEEFVRAFVSKKGVRTGGVKKN